MLGGQNPRVLLVEDDPAMCAAMERMLGRLGYGICGTARAAREAVELAERTRPDVALVDVKLEGPADGVDAACEIGARLATPVVFVTGHSDEATVARVTSASASGFLLKPFDVEALGVALRMALTRHERELAWHRGSGPLANLGPIVANLSHEMNNPLAAIGANASYVSKRLAALEQELARAADAEAAREAWLRHGASALEAVRDIEDANRRLVKLVANIHPPPDRPGQRVNVEALLRWALDATASRLRNTARVDLDLHVVPPIQANPARTANALLRALLDAADAADAAGPDATVRVELRTESDAVVVHVEHPALPPSYPSALHALLEAGTRVVRSAQRTSISFPLQNVATTASPRPRVLLVDDDETMLRALARTLKALPIEVRTMTDARQALEAFLEERHDLVLCDVSMPGYDGIAFHGDVLAKAPELASRVVFITGGSTTARATSYLARADVRSVPKPFGPNEIVGWIRQCLDLRAQ
jgi:DNA-binding response OmpR family regulator